MDARNPKVSVVIPAYNSAGFTVEAVESVLQQTYPDYEVIVVDDGSTDNTGDVLRPYLDRIQYVYKENGGACSARNLGIKLSKGEYIACLDCDDLWLPDKLAHSIPVMDANPEAAFVFTACYTIDSEGSALSKIRRILNRDRAYIDLLLDNYVLAPTVVMRKSCLNQVGLFDERIFIPADWDLWLRLSKRFPIYYIDLPLSKYRMASKYTLSHIEQSLEECIYVLEKQFRASRELPSRDRDRIAARMLYVHGMLYRDASDVRNARSMLSAAFRRYPCDWRIFCSLLLSFLGGRAWITVSKLNRFFVRCKIVPRSSGDFGRTTG